MIDTIFSPAFGNRPYVMVGRETVISQLKQGLSSPPGSRDRATLLLGQRGYGKTVLLLEMADIARAEGYVVASPTVVSKGMLDRILEKIIEDAKSLVKDSKPGISGGSLSIMGFGAGIDFQKEESAPKSFAHRLANLCRELNKRKKGLLILIDEVQAGNDDLRQLIIAYQELVGENADIALMMAGLPHAVASTLNDHVLTFLNRAPKLLLEPLKTNVIEAYYVKAFHSLKLNISAELIQKAAAEAQGSPYLMQLIGHYITLTAPDNLTITNKTFSSALRMAKDDFINDICQTSLASLSEKDLAFLSAMSQDAKESKIEDIARRMSVSASYVQTYKRRLLQSGVIESPRRGVVRFTIPYLKEYLSKL